MERIPRELSVLRPRRQRGIVHEQGGHEAPPPWQGEAWGTAMRPGTCARVTVEALASIMQYTHDTLQHLERYNGGYAVQLGRLNISRIEHYFSTMRSGEQTLNATRLVVKHQRSQAAATADNLQARADYTV